MRMSIVGLIALGLIAAFSAALLMAAIGKSPNGTSALSPGDREVTLVVAARDLPAVTRLRADDLTRQTVKADQAPEAPVLEPVRAVGKILARPLVAGQPLTDDCFARNSRGMELVADLPPGKRAVTVELKLSDGLEGLLYPGSVVDVLAFFRFDRDTREKIADAVSTTLLQGVTVLAIDDVTSASGEGDDGEEDKGVLSRRKTRRVTLLVDSRQAEALQLASAQGTVSLAMRNPQDNTQADRDATLLSGGQLASLAEYLGSWVGEEVEGETTDAASQPPPVESAPARPARGARRISEWNITVMRGDQVEVKSFIRDGGEADNLAKRLN